MIKMPRLQALGRNIILPVVFAALAIVAIKPLLAALGYDMAERSVDGYQWVRAEKYFKGAVDIDSSNSQYTARIGEFLLTQSGYKDNKIPSLEMSKRYYERATVLNPRCAGYFTKLGQIYISLSIDTESGRGYIEKAFENFRKAIENDPNGFDVAYVVGYSSLSVWERLNESEKAISIDRLKYSLKQKPWYSGYIYPAVIKKTGNVKLVESIIPEIEARQWVNQEKIDDLKRAPLQGAASDIISRSGWQGASADGGSIYENGNMYWSGTLYGAMLFPKGSVSIRVEASGSPADGVYPYMLVSLDGKRIGSAYIDSPELKDYAFAVNTDGGIKVLGITFTNDGGNKKEDRNLYIGSARVEQI